MKIKRAPKKSPSTNGEIAAFVLSSLRVGEEELPTLLGPITDHWEWPRTDLQHWIGPLDRFDAILERFTNDYDLSSMEHPQTNEFTPRTKELILSILSFTKTLLENSTNRKIYNSFDRLNQLLHTTDQQVLLATLKLALRPAQQYSSANPPTAFAISEQRLLTLAQGWATREHGIEMVDLAAAELPIPAQLDQLEWQFYSKFSSPTPKRVAMDLETDSVDQGPISTPAKPRATFAQGSLLATPIPSTPVAAAAASSAPTQGLTTVLLGNVRADPKSAVDILVDAIERHQIPESDRLQLLQKLRIAKSLDNTEARRSMLVLRLLAIAVFAHTATESTASSKLFLYEPELIPQLAELVHPDRAVPIEIQAAAFNALDAIAKFKSKLGEVASALNASVSHGILMYVVRRTVNDLAGDNPVSTPEFIDALFNILTYFQTSAFVGNMIVGAGVVSLLIDFVKNQRRDRVAVATRSIVFLDSLMYGYSSAFTLFGTAGGLAIFVNRVKDEIEMCVAAHGDVVLTDITEDSPTGLLSFEQGALLKALLRSLQRLMQTAGTTEGLRNLIDTSLLSSVKEIMVHRKIFGPQLFALAINITATFVHNEPTCLSVIQEAKVPEALYDAIEDSIPASIDVIQAISNAVGALCLNTAGLALFETRNIICSFFSIFSSERHVRILQDRDNGNLVGASFDELIRHHPTLKDKVFDGIVEALKSIKADGTTFKPEGAGEGYNLQLAKISDDTAPAVDPVAASVVETPAGETPVKIIEEPKENSVLSSAEVIGRFLEGLFQNLSHAKDFVKLNPYGLILDLFEMDACPALLPGTSAFVSLCSALRILSEVKPAEMVAAVLGRVKLSLAATEPFWNDSVKVDTLFDITAENYEEKNKNFRYLSTLLSNAAVLSDVYSSLSYTHGRIASTVLAALTASEDLTAIKDLGRLYQFAVQESIIIETLLSTLAAAEKDSSTGMAIAEDRNLAMRPNIKICQDVVTSLPSHIAPFFQSIVKLFVHRRSSDILAHRQAARTLSTTIAEVMTTNLRWIDAEDPSRSLSYSTSMITATTGLLFDERSQGGLQSMLLLAFETAGGFKNYIAVFSKILGVISNSFAIAEEGAKPELGVTVVSAFKALDAALALLQRLTSHRTLLDSPQTALLANREKDKTKADYFDAHFLLISIRATVFEPLLTTWRGGWIRRSPPSVVRSIAATLLNILRAEGEIGTETPVGGVQGNLAQPFFTGALAPLAAAAGPPAVFAVDEAKVTQLIDMGFPRAAAVVALTRYRNNLGAAAEYLLSHPDLVGAARTEEAGAAARADAVDPAPVVPAVELAAVEPVAAAEPAEVAMNEEPAVEAEGDLVMLRADLEAQREVMATEIAARHEELAKHQATLKVYLDERRTETRPIFLAEALSVAEDFPLLVFDIKSAFSLLGSPEVSATLNLQKIVSDLESRLVSDSSRTTDAAAVSVRLRLIALLSTDAVYRETVEATREQLMKVLLRYAGVYQALSPAVDDRPVWLPSAMLVADSLFSLAEVPAPTTIMAAGVAPPSTALVGQGPAWINERKAYFDVAMDVLAKGISSRDVFASTLRLLLVLTRDADLATAFVTREGLRLLLGSFTSDRPETEGCRPFVGMILRHIVESKEVLRPIMEREIEAWFATPRSKIADITAFLRGAGPIAFRDVPTFLEATRATCKLVQADAPGHYHVALQQDPQPTAKTAEIDATILSPFAGDGTATASNEMQLDEPSKSIKTVATPVSAAVETTVHFLMTEILELTKIVGNATPPAAPLIPAVAVVPVPSTVATVTVGDTKIEPVVPDPAIATYFHAAFNMSCLAELISSYSICKTSFLSFSPRRSKDNTTTKIRSSFLIHLLHEVIPVPTVVSPTDAVGKRRAQLSQWASLIVVALCFDTEPTHSKDASSAELTITRKAVLDAIVKAFKDTATSTESTDVRYGRLFALSDLCSRLLTCRPYPTVTKASDETSMQLAKLMLEKNFAVILTNALAEVDLNFPSVNNLINSILRPLEQLTKVVTKVGRAKPTVATARDVDQSSVSSYDEGEEIELDTEEEEAPDLYRNSALGMYEGELEPGHVEDAYMSGSSAEDYDEDDEDMEDMEDGVPGSDVSDVSDDEGEMAFGDEIEGMSTDDLDGGEHDSEDDSDDDSGEELEMDDGDEDMIVTGLDGVGDVDDPWEDEPDGILDEFEAAEAAGLDGEGFEHSGGLLRDDDDGETDEDDLTDQEEMYLQGELEFDAEVQEQAAAAAQGRGNTGWDVLGGFGNADPRRNRLMDDMMQLNDSAALFGRSRNTGASNAAPHPLLVDTPSGDSASRRQRGDTSQGTPEYNAWVESIEQMLGGGAIEQLQQLLSAHGMARIDSPNQIRIQQNTGPEGGLAVVLDPAPLPLPAGARAPGLPGRAMLPSTRTPRQATERVNSTTDFLPVTTIQRWQEESRICGSGILPAERVARLVNHVINELHAPARAINDIARADQAASDAAAEARELYRNDAADDDEDEDIDVEAAANDAEDTMEGMADDLAEVMELARSLAAGLAATPAPTPPIATHAPVEATTAPFAEAAPVEAEPVAAANAVEETPAPIAGGAGAAARVTIEIHGETVDITDTGIDPTFLEALPDDMREEVLNQHFRESRAAPPPQAVPSSINSEFLDALPPDLRAEVLRQEAAEQRREQAAERAIAAAAAGTPVGANGPADPAEDDRTNFFREQRALDAQFIGGFPAELAAEADVLRRRTAARSLALGLQAGAGALPLATKKAAPHREAIQLLDKSGLATLVRLLFFPQPLRKNALQKVLVNLCENSRTRIELINLLLTILHDGTRDVSAVDKSFSQMSLRASKSLAISTPRRKTAPETPGAPIATGSSLPNFPAESVPNLIAQRCLEALTFLVSSNEQSPLFFLTEQEVVIGLNRRSSKKGKGKEKAVSSTTYPIIVLLGLLDRPALLKTQSMMDSLTLLLSAITKSLSVLQKKGAADGAIVVDTLTDPLAAPLPTATATSAQAVPATDAAATTAEAPSNDPVSQASTSDLILANPTVLPPAVIRLVVNVLDAGECSSKTFQQTLVLIQNLSYLPEAREIISEELKTRAQGLCTRLIPDLDELLSAIRSADDVRGVTLAKFSPASSLQAQLLRILKTIDWIHSPPKKTTPAASDSLEDLALGEKKLTPEELKVSSIYESFTAAGLWQQLGACLVGIEAKPELLFIATVLLPLIESLMVVSKYVGSKRSARDVASPIDAVSPQPMETLKPETMEEIFLAFTDEHRKILNTMVRNNPSLMSGSFAILVHNPKVLEFDNKRSYFFSRLHDRTQRQRNHYGPLQVNVRRQYVFEDSFHNLQRRSGDEIKYGKLSVRFYDEEGVDAGGVTREWFSVLARQMFNPGYALFQPQAADALTYQPSKSSGINPEHLLFFKFVGRIIGKALHDQRLLEAYFSRSVYKHMLGKPVDHRDLESIDPEYHKSLVWMLENDIDGVLDLTFSVERDDFGVADIIDLVPDGRNVVVTNENKAEYVRLIADYRLSSEIKDQIAALLKGLYEIVPKDLLQIFSERELELLISGLPEIDVDEWRANTDLVNFSASDPVVGYFWRAVRSFTHEERAKLLQFITGSSRVPLEGFGSLQGMNGITKFSLTSNGESASLPTAHTCFNQLMLSNYTSYETLRYALLLAVNEGGGGFGFA